MSFRVEEKISATPYEIEILYAELIQKGMRLLYPTRIIHSIYFDTMYHQILADSEEGCLPRRKIRIRHYPNEKEPAHQLEIKISAIEGRYKTSKPISKTALQKILNLGVYDGQYGLLMPKTEVCYHREYCQLDNIRITFDRHIQYRRFQANHQNHYDNYIVLEIKNPYQENIDFIQSLIPVARRRFSKFAQSMLISYSQ